MQLGEVDPAPSHEREQLESSVSRTAHEADGGMVGCPAACCQSTRMKQACYDAAVWCNAHMRQSALRPVQAASQASAPGPSYQQSTEAAAADRFGAPQQQAFIEGGRIPPEWVPAPNLGPSSYIVPSRNPGGTFPAATAILLCSLGNRGVGV